MDLAIAQGDLDAAKPLLESVLALDDKRSAAAAHGLLAEAARAAADPQPDMRGSVGYKRALVVALVKRAIEIAVQRARGEQVEVRHIYA